VRGRRQGVLNGHRHFIREREERKILNFIYSYMELKELSEIARGTESERSRRGEHIFQGRRVPSTWSRS
jgi:hypothetical protein